MQTELYDKEELIKEVQSYNNILNLVLGIMSFTFGLTCLSFQSPDKAALLCLGIIIPLFIEAIKKFPPTIKAVRDLEKELNKNYKQNQDELEEIGKLRKYLEKKYLSIKSILKFNFLYLFGVVFYFIVLLRPETLLWFKI